MKTAIRRQEKTTVAAARERRPFLWIEPRPEAQLPDSARSGLEDLEEIVSAEVPGLVRTLVGYALSARTRRQRWSGRRVAPSMSTINRCRRAARQWIQMILSGKTDRDTLHAVATGLIPQLAGSGPELHLGERTGVHCVEFLRGAVTARIFDQEAESLVPQAKALHTFETVLAIHLAAYGQAAASSRLAASS